MNKMEILRPKKFIINFFDHLINQVDINIENSIKTLMNEGKYSEMTKIGEHESFEIARRDFFYVNSYFDLEYFESNEREIQVENEWSISTNMVDYVNQVREKTIEKLRKAQKESLD